MIHDGVLGIQTNSYVHFFLFLFIAEPFVVQMIAEPFVEVIPCEMSEKTTSLPLDFVSLSPPPKTK